MGQIIARYLFGGRIDENIARWRPSEGTAWYLADHLGTIRDLAERNGLLIASQRFDSFGQTLATTGSGLDRFGFTGRELVAETGNIFYRARFYDPAVGRFSQLDPSGFAAGDANLARYAANNPLSFSDPSGLVALPSRAAITNFLIFSGAGLLGCVLGDLVDGDLDVLEDNLAEIAVRGGTFFILSQIFISIAKLGRAPIPVGGLAASSFGLGLVICATS
jgi:RHS repeat-associated protein